MFWPMDIATDLAKKQELREKLVAELEKLDKEIAELEAKESEK